MRRRGMMREGRQEYRAERDASATLPSTKSVTAVTEPMMMMKGTACVDENDDGDVKTQFLQIGYRDDDEKERWL
jgi:hypothetical protein